MPWSGSQQKSSLWSSCCYLVWRCPSSLRLLCASCIQGLFSWQRCSCLPPCPFPAPAGTSVPVPPPSQGTAVTGLLLEPPISSTAWGMQVHQQPWMQLLIHRRFCLGSRSAGLCSQQCGLVVRPLKSQAAPTAPCRCTLPSPEISVGAEPAH